MQWLGKNVGVAMNIHAKTEELLDVSFSMQPMLFQRKVGDYFFQKLLV
jgi:hypothetical protein